MDRALGPEESQQESGGGGMNEELPDSWIRSSFSSVVVDPIQRVPSEKETITYIDIGSVDRDTKTIKEPQSMLGKDAPSRARKVIHTGDVLVSTVRPNLNAVAMVDSKYDGQFASTGFDVLRSPVVDPRWLFYSVRTPEFLDRMSELVQGALYPAVRSKDIRSFVIPIAPLAEQKRIADKLETVLSRVDACRARLDRVPALLKRFRQSVLAAAASGQLTEDWRESFAGAEESYVDRIRRLNERYSIPDKWEVTTLSNLSTMVTSGSRGWADYYSSTGAVFIRAQNINTDQLDLEDVAHVLLPDKAEGKRAVVKRNDLLITITGANVGKSARVKIDLKEAYISQHIALVKLSDSKLSAFIELFLWAENAGRGQLNEAAYGGGKPGLNLQNIRELIIGLPPLPEQQEIVRRVEALFTMADRIEARLATAQKTVERLTPATLAKAFRGELVPQDPNDEPASALLSRLLTHLEAKPSKTKRKKHA